MEQSIDCALVSAKIKNTFGRDANVITRVCVKCYEKDDYGFFWNVPKAKGIGGNQRSVNGDKAQKFSTFDDAKRACIVSLNNHFDNVATATTEAIVKFRKDAGIDKAIPTKK